MRQAIRILIHFKNEAPGFRYYAMRKGRECGIKGIIPLITRNTIVIHAEGTPASLDAYLDILKTGTPFCNIEHFSTFNAQVFHYNTLEITNEQSAAADLYPSGRKPRILRLGIFGL
ncbi:acylphosphatase [Lentimicrobium sp.]|uniref:acylphosphatase n=1 Tax=Lentimicrobium sp. TaxID=2034841 RepID=UPI0025FD11CD|nr:acylphosphatase [Lentimicrobium sp.]MCO5257436.1 acylphosphatase [Lentimicrobium sp.]MCO5263929.1 acylphosphatase [Lentimicrobium sp.]HPF65931.1 acylphosphatase [Lentimicrobium sp.]HPJ63549.1 acylphosphatase [Lentimicrobium sp.]HPR27236.1 acylphosphatase [Lentimicrobium sp.]